MLYMRGYAMNTNQGQNMMSGQVGISSLGSDIVARARSILSSSSIIRHPGSTMCHIVYNGAIVGYIWENVSKDKLEIGKPLFNGYYWYVPLQHKGKVIGYLYV